MVGALFLELQLDILELAIPPPTLRNLDERRQACRTLSLVHRDWTRTAQKHLFSCPSILVHDTVQRAASLNRWLEQKGEREPTVVEIHFATSGLWAGMWEFSHSVKPALPKAKRVLFFSPGGHLAIDDETFAGIKDLCWKGGENDCGLWLRQLPSELASLTVNSTSLRLNEQIGRPFEPMPLFSSLATLILLDVVAVVLPAHFLARMPSLKILAWCKVQGSSLLNFLQGARDLRLSHLLLQIGASYPLLLETIHKPPRTLTFISPRPDGRDKLEAWCLEKKVELRYMDEGEGKELDLELWALSRSL
ncbi:hypothetical protein JCM6882_000185 [Rhodosporidiobolus microsporus]